MIKTKNIGVMIVLLTQLLNAWGQEWETISVEDFKAAIVEMEKQIPENTSYGFDAKYAFFEYETSADTTQVMDYRFDIQPAKSVFNMLQLGREIVQTKTAQIICDSMMQQLIIQPPTQDLFARRMTDDFAPLMTGLFPTFKQEKNGLIGYRVQFPEGMQYTASELWINKRNEVKKYVLFSAHEIMDDNGDEERLLQPRLEVIFTKFRSSAQVNRLNLKTEAKFFKDFNGLIPQDKYKEFEIIDLRIQE